MARVGGERRAWNQMGGEREEEREGTEERDGGKRRREGIGRGLTRCFGGLTEACAGSAGLHA